MNVEFDKEWELRARQFFILARGLTCPDEELCAAVADGSFSEEAREVVRDLFPVMRSSLEEELDELARAADASDFLSSMRREYSRLFTAPQQALIPIWESLFLKSPASSDFGRVLIRSREEADARRQYEDAGVSLTTQEAADHMRLECEFAGYLCRCLCSAGDASTRAVWCNRLGKFARTHFEGWYGAFFQELARQAYHPFYRALAVVGQANDVGKLKELE